MLFNDMGNLFDDIGTSIDTSPPGEDTRAHAKKGKTGPKVARSWSCGPGMRVTTGHTVIYQYPAAITDGLTNRCKVREASTTIDESVAAAESIADAARATGLKIREASATISATIEAAEAIAASARTVGLRLRKASITIAESVAAKEHMEPSLTDGIRVNTASTRADPVGFLGFPGSPGSSGSSASACTVDNITTYEREERSLSLGWEPTRAQSASPPRGRRRIPSSPQITRGKKESMKDLRGRMLNDVQMIDDYDDDKFSGCVKINITSRFDPLCAVGANVAKTFQDNPDAPEQMLAGRVVAQRVVSRSPLKLMYDVVFSSGVREQCHEIVVRKYVDNFSNASMYHDQGALRPVMVKIG